VTAAGERPGEAADDVTPDRTDTPDPTDDTRRPRSVYGVGTEPDPRFSLANERTALAWMRTALALVAGGVGLTSLGSLASLPAFLDVVAAVACLGGGALAVRSVRGWRSHERSLRLGRPLTAPRSLARLAALVVVLALVLAGYALSQVR
jgi:putative membrane protein